MPRPTVLALAASLTLLLPGGAWAQIKHYALESAEGLRLHNVSAEPATVQGRKGLRLKLSDEAAHRLDDQARARRAVRCQLQSPSQEEYTLRGQQSC